MVRGHGRGTVLSKESRRLGGSSVCSATSHPRLVRSGESAAVKWCRILLRAASSPPPRAVMDLCVLKEEHNAGFSL